jgi:hypothetical protein
MSNEAQILAAERQRPLHRILTRTQPSRHVCKKLLRATMSPHQMQCILIDFDFDSLSIALKRRLGVVSRSGPHLICVSQFGLFTAMLSAAHFPQISVFQRSLQTVSALRLTTHEPQPSLTERIYNLTTCHRAGYSIRYYCTSAMSLVPEIRSAEHHTSLEEMQEDKTAVQLKGGTFEDEHEMSRTSKTQELRI